jgi:hypothetical protein
MPAGDARQIAAFCRRFRGHHVMVNIRRKIFCTVKAGVKPLL